MADAPAVSIPSFADVAAARQRIAPHIHHTPVLSSGRLNRETGAELLFKCENFQRTGSFKPRGAFSMLLALPAGQRARGVATHSSGNHGAALALAAAETGIPATVVMPFTAPAAKKAAVAGYGARIVECEPTLAARLAAAEQVLAETGATFVPPFDHPLIIAGQGTALLEFLEDVPEPLDMVLAPVGGGGLVGGSAIVAAARQPGLAVIAAEPDEADDAARSFRTGVRQPQRLPVTTIADGLTTATSELTFAILKHGVRDVVTTSEAAIIAAMRLLWSTMKIVVEPSSAVPLAAILEGKVGVAGKRVGIIVSGGNVDLDRLPWAG